MTRALQHAYSTTVDMDDERSVFQGHLRIVRNPRRARLLKRRGVELDYYNNPLALGNGPTRFWVWFETFASFEARTTARKTRNALRRKVREAQHAAKLAWVDTLLRDVLQYDYTNIEARVLADLQAKGYSIQIDQPSDIQRAARESPKMRLYYLDLMAWSMAIDPTTPEQRTQHITVNFADSTLGDLGPLQGYDTTDDFEVDAE